MQANTIDGAVFKTFRHRRRYHHFIASLKPKILSMLRERGTLTPKPADVVQPVDAGDAAEELQATNMIDPALVSAGMEPLASVTRDEISTMAGAPVEPINEAKPDFIYKKIREVLEGGELSQAQISKRTEYHGDQRFLKTALEALVQMGEIKVDKPEGKGCVARYMLTRASLKDRITEQVKKGVDNYQDLGQALGLDKHSLKPAVRQLVQDGSLRWKGGAYGRLEIPGDEKPCESCSSYCDEPVTFDSLDEPAQHVSKTTRPVARGKPKKQISKTTTEAMEGEIDG